MNVEIEKVYTQKELFALLNITQCTWTRRKEDFLEHLKDYFNYEIYRGTGNTVMFIIHEVIAEYQPLPRKSNTPEKYKDYEQFTLEFIPNNPLNTPTNIARNAVEDKKLKEKYHHQPGSAVRYIRETVRSDKVQTVERVWCRLSKTGLEYVPLTDGQVEFLQDGFSNHSKSFTNNQIDIWAQVQNGELTREEAKESLTAEVESMYGSVIGRFVQVYGFRPFKVPKLELNPFATAIAK